MPASVPPMMNVITTTRSTSIPMRLAISRSWATARIDLPVRVRCTNSSSTTITTIEVTTTTGTILSKLTLPIVMLPSRNEGRG